MRNLRIVLVAIMPTQTSIELPLLKVIADSGGRIPPSEEDLASQLKSGGNRWRDSVLWTRLALVRAGELDGSVRGIWKITDKGKSRLEQEWSSWKPRYRRQVLARVLVTGTIAPAKEEVAGEKNPQEILEDTLDTIDENLKTEILDTLSSIDPSLFENIVVVMVVE
jgi:restriction endonuclease Mrr